MKICGGRKEKEGPQVCDRVKVSRVARNAPSADAIGVQSGDTPPCKLHRSLILPCCRCRTSFSHHPIYSQHITPTLEARVLHATPTGRGQVNIGRFCEGPGPARCSTD